MMEEVELAELLGARLTSRYSNIFEIECLEEDATILDLKIEIPSEYGIDPRYQVIFSGTVYSSNDNGNNSNNNKKSKNDNDDVVLGL